MRLAAFSSLSVIPAKSSAVGLPSLLSSRIAIPICPCNRRFSATMSATDPSVNSSDKPTLYVKAAPDGSVGDCPFSHKANLALTFRHVDYTVQTIDLNNKPDWFIDLNEAGTTPLWLDGTSAVGESDDIVDIADTLGYGPTLVRENDPNWDAAFEAVSPTFGCLVRLMKNKDTAKEQSLAEALIQSLRSLDTFLRKVPGNFLLGDQVSALDCNLAPKLKHISVAAKHYKNLPIPQQFTAVVDYLHTFEELKQWTSTAPVDDGVYIAGWSKFFK